MQDKFVVKSKDVKGLQTVGNEQFVAMVKLAFVKAVGEPEETLSISLFAGGEHTTVTVPYWCVSSLVDEVRRRESAIAPDLVQRIIEGRIT